MQCAMQQLITCRSEQSRAPSNEAPVPNVAVDVAGHRCLPVRANACSPPTRAAWTC